MRNTRGFTIIEVLLASIIFMLAILAIVKARTTSLRNVFQSEKITIAAELAQDKMTELQLKFQKGIDKNGLATSFEKLEGTFDKPYDEFKWKAELGETTVKISVEELTKFLVSLGMDEEEVKTQFDNQRIIITNVNKIFKENLGELTLSVEWKQFGQTLKLPLVTHLLPTKPKIQFTQTAED